MALVVFLSVRPADAANAGASSEGEVHELHWRVFSALRQAQQVSGARLKSAQAMNPFWDAVLQDGRIDEAERAIIAKLGDPRHATLHLTSVFPTGTRVELRFVNQLRPEALARAAELSQMVDDSRLRLEQLWRVESADETEFYREFLGDESRRATLVAFLKSLAAQSWAQSSRSNGFGPFRDLIARAFGRIQTGQPQLGPEEKRVAFRLLHDALATFEPVSPDAGRPPAPLYNWIASVEPKEHQPGQIEAETEADR